MHNSCRSYRCNCSRQCFGTVVWVAGRTSSL